MRIRKRPPTHPGQMLKMHYLLPLKLNVTQVATALHVSRKTLSKIVNEGGAVTPDMALRLSRAFGTSPEVWLNLQQTYDLWHAYHDSSEWKSLHRIAA